MKHLTLTTLFALAIFQLLACDTYMEAEEIIADPNESPTKQIAAPLPKLALIGTASEFKAGVQYHKVSLTISNWEKYQPQMFLLPTGRRLPPNPCGPSKTRVVTAIYTERGVLLSGCTPISKPADLTALNISIRRGPVPPKFVYVVISDLHTGAVYRSNMVSP